jgi:lipoate-protein ligase A
VTAADEQAFHAAALAAPVTEPGLRLWRYDAPAVVLGPAQRPDDGIEARARAAGATVITRMTGGGAVLAGPWLLGLSVVLPPDHPQVRPSLRASYHWLGAALASWLAGLGVPARALEAPPTRPPADLAWACFAGVSWGEVEAGGRKIVGLAQARRKNGVLFSAGVLVATTPWPLLAEILGRPATEADELQRRTVSVAELVGQAPSGADLPAVIAAAAGR